MDTTLLHAPALARRIGVPAYWLRREADAGRLPHVRAGTRYLFDAALVERLLLERAASGEPDPRSAREEAHDASS